ncbi:MAG: hypothetical protein JXJ20_02120 [Anaerolineae bacterium]|nr:hypothetical protein [Anaerolineae bacterium]
MRGDHSPNREQIFQFIVDYKREHDGLAPTVTEIAKECMLSTSTVSYHLMKLQIERRILISGRRSIEVIGGVWNLPDEDDTG